LHPRPCGQGRGERRIRENAIAIEECLFEKSPQHSFRHGTHAVQAECTPGSFPGYLGTRRSLLALHVPCSGSEVAFFKLWPALIIIITHGALRAVKPILRRNRPLKPVFASKLAPNSLRPCCVFAV